MAWSLEMQVSLKPPQPDTRAGKRPLGQLHSCNLAIGLWPVTKQLRSKVAVVAAAAPKEAEGGAPAAEALGRLRGHPRRILVSTGDVMGDLHAAALTRELLSLARTAGVHLEVLALGGTSVQAAGAQLIGDNSGLSSIGFLEALPLVWPTLGLLRAAKEYLRAHPPDAAGGESRCSSTTRE